MIELKNVTKTYTLGDEVFTALKNISLKLDKGEFSSIVGPSGSGKSTLMHIIGLLDKPTSGTVLIGEKDVLSLSDDRLSLLRNEFVGFVFQQFNLIPKLTVYENIMLPILYNRRILGFNPKERVQFLMKRCGIDEKADSFPNKISGGQQQRVAIARALITKPELILADEPTGNLDTQTGDTIIELLKTLNEEDGVTVVIVTHEKDVADKTKRKITIKNGEIVI